MAPSRAPWSHEVSTAPLADFFWIAGVDGQEVLDTYVRWRDVANGMNIRNQGPADTIEEDQDAEQDELFSILESPRPTSPQSKRNSYQRLSRLSYEARGSIRSLDHSTTGNSSKRSSATIRAVPSPGPRHSMLLSDADFDKALKNFALDRDSFFLDLNFSASAVAQPNRPRPRPKTQKILPDDLQQAPSRAMGSLRRHMSFREMSSMKRQPSVARQGGSTSFGPLLTQWPLT